MVAALRETDLFEQVVDPGLVGLLTGNGEGKDDDLLGVQHRQQVEELEDEPDVPAAELRETGVAQFGDVRAGDGDLGRGRLVTPCESVNQRRPGQARRTRHSRTPTLLR